MPKKIFDPDTLFPAKPIAFSQVVTSTGGTTVHCAGQTASDLELNTVGVGDFPRQVEKALDNVRLALAAAGATPRDVVRVTTYVVDYGPDKLDTVVGGLAEFFGGDDYPAATLLGVQALALPDLMVEIEVTAVID